MITAAAMKAGVGGGYDADEAVNNDFAINTPFSEGGRTDVPGSYLNIYPGYKKPILPKWVNFSNS